MRTSRNENYKFYFRQTCILCTLRRGTQASLSAEAPALAKVAAAASFSLIDRSSPAECRLKFVMTDDNDIIYDRIDYNLF